LIGIEGEFAVVADIPNAVPIDITLIWVSDKRTVVAGISNTVVVRVQVEDRGNFWTEIAGITIAIHVCVDLICIANQGAVVNVVTDTVTILVILANGLIAVDDFRTTSVHEGIQDKRALGNPGQVH
jgi:hypothetical protein